MAEIERRPVDPAAWQAYLTAMTETVIPQIIRDVQRREQLAAERRYVPRRRSDG